MQERDVWLHDPEHGTHHRGTAEVEAESVAYVVCHAAGLDTADYTLSYVATWAAGDISAIRSTAERVIASARRALEAAGLVEPNGEGQAA